jgi:hypothetical protein
MNTAAMTFGEKLTIDDIERLSGSPADTPIVVWSMQQPGAIERLLESGTLTGDPRFAFAADTTGYTKRGKRMAYAWMEQQMCERLKGYRGELPLWVVLSPPEFATKEGDKLLKLEISKSQMLISYYQPWVDLLHIMAQLESSGGWPEHWISTIPYLTGDAVESRRNIYLNGVDGALRTRWEEPECRLSWECMFDLTLARRDNFIWELMLQGVVPTISVTDVKDILSIDLRKPW